MTALTSVGLNEYLLVAAILFGIGALVVMTRRNAVAVLMGVELILNAASLNFVAFSHYVQGALTGMVFSVFIIVLAAAEAAIALAIVVSVFRRFHTIDAQETTALKE